MSIFSVERPESIQETMENMMRANAERQANLALLREQMALEAEEAEKQEKLLAQDKAQQEQEKKNQAMEEAMHAKRVADSKKAVLEARFKLPSLARESIIRKTLFDITMESLWIDDEVKNTQEMRCEALKVFNETIEKCDKITGKPLMSAMENTKLLSCINDIATEEGNAIAERIITEADENDEISINFRMNADEINEVDRKMGELGTKELAKEIKKKVLKVVEDEKESGKVKAELFAELDDASKEEEEESETGMDQDTNSEDSENMSEEMEQVLSGEVVTERTSFPNVKAMKVWFSSCARDMKTSLKSADSKFKSGDYTGAKKDYDATINNANKLIVELRDIDYDSFSGVGAAIFGPYYALWLSIQDMIINSSTPALKNLNISKTELQNMKNKCSAGMDGTQKSIGIIVGKIVAYCKYQSKECDKLKNKKVNKPTTESLDELRLRLVRENANRTLNSMNGSSVFESIMMKSLNDIDAENPTMEGASLLESEKRNAALLQTVLEYTVLETLNTLKVYDFNLRNIGMVKKM